MPSPWTDTTYLTDGSCDWSGGVDSLAVPTIASPRNPNGLARNKLAWLVNATVRDGGISPRNGYSYRETIHDKTGLFQGGDIYQPLVGIPYLMVAISGQIYQVFPDNPGSITNLSKVFNLSLPPNLLYFFFQQAEQFMVIQAGDNVTLPLIWDGTTLRRSVGIVNPNPPPPSVPPVTYQIAILNNFVMPAVGGQVTLQINVTYPDPNYLTDQIAINAYNSVFTASAPTTTAGRFFITLTVVSTPVPGYNGYPNGATFSWTTIPPVNPVVNPFVPEIPAAGAMDYFMGRLWYEIAGQYFAGDIVGGPSGSNVAPTFYQQRDSILKQTENPMVLNGDGFTVPDQAGNISALFHSTQINAVLGQGQLYIGTAQTVYSQYVPVTRADWIAANNANQPLQTVVQISNGPVNDRSIVTINGDLYYQTWEPGISSFIIATRYFDQPGNIELSAAEDRILNFVNRQLLPFATGCYYDNRLLESSLPRQLPQGVVHDAMIPLDFLPISTFASTFQPAWEGHHEGLQVLQMLTGNFSNTKRAFCLTVSSVDSSIQLYEIVQEQKFDYNTQITKVNPTGESRIQWQFETPAFTWGDEFQLKKLVGGEFSVDRIFGQVVFKLEWRPDSETCYQTWAEWEVCSARNSAEDVNNPTTYPLVQFGEGFRNPMQLPKPPRVCNNQSRRPSDVAFQHQFKLTVHGFCRIRGFQFYAEPVQRNIYEFLICGLKKFVGLLNRFIG